MDTFTFYEESLHATQAAQGAIQYSLGPAARSRWRFWLQATRSAAGRLAVTSISAADG